MADSMSPKDRSRRMSLIRSKNTKPEMIVRRLVHALGYRYRLHDPHLPGKPDLVFRQRHKVIFVHGCFWHRHGDDCPLTRMPKSRLDFWKPKLEDNERRDRSKQEALRALGWKFLIIWECQLKDLDGLTRRVRDFME